MTVSVSASSTWEIAIQVSLARLSAPTDWLE